MTEAERETEFDKAIAPLNRQEFGCLPLEAKRPAIARYLARIDSDQTPAEPSDPAECARKGNDATIRQFYKSTGPTPRCWKIGCEELCEVNSWFCPAHTKREDVAPVAERIQWAELGWRLFLLITAAWIVGFVAALTGVAK